MGRTLLCARVFGHVIGRAVPTDWLASQIAALIAQGDIDTLMQRLSGVRIWSYRGAGRLGARLAALARRAGRTNSPISCERLTARFVDRRSAFDAAAGGDGRVALLSPSPAAERSWWKAIRRSPEGWFVPDPVAEGDEETSCGPRGVRAWSRAGCRRGNPPDANSR